MSDYDRRLRATMTVGELIEVLEGYEHNIPVVVVCDYGDYHNTPQAIMLPSGEEEVRTLVESAYSQSGLAVYRGRDDEDDREEAEPEDAADEDDEPKLEALVLGVMPSRWR